MKTKLYRTLISCALCKQEYLCQPIEHLFNNEEIELLEEVKQKKIDIFRKYLIKRTNRMTNGTMYYCGKNWEKVKRNERKNKSSSKVSRIKARD